MFLQQLFALIKQRHTILLSELLKQENNHPIKEQIAAYIVNSGNDVDIHGAKEVEATSVEIC